MTLKELLGILWKKGDVDVSRRSVGGGDVVGPVWFLKNVLTSEFLNSEVDSVYKNQITLKDFSFREEKD